MSYSALEASVDQAAPFFLHAFRQGDAVWRFTSRAESLESVDPALDPGDPPVVWEAAAVGHSSVVQSGDLERVRLDLTWPLSHPFPRRFLEPLGSVPTGLTIWRGHEALPDAPVAHYKGRVTGSEVEGARIVISAESVQSLLKRAGVRAKYQRLCRHALYGAGCGLDVSAFREAATATAVAGRLVTVPALGGFPAHIVRDCLVDAVWGLGIPEADIGAMRSAPGSSRCSCRPCARAMWSSATTSTSTRTPAPVPPSRHAAPSCGSCRPIRQTSTRSRWSSPSSRP